MDSDEFVTMMLVDGCFIIELLLRTYYTDFRDAEHSILLATRLCNDIYRDLILLENQIPFFVLEGIFNLAMADFNLLPLLDLPLYFFENYNVQQKPPSELNAYCKDPRHKWKATLKHDYFNSPWRTASTSAAIVLLALTFIQTVCSILGATKVA
ncbi:hypothetical protein LguiA_033119 [Lonicera macranthoides]